jgi:ATP synthase protein I
MPTEPNPKRPALRGLAQAETIIQLALAVPFGAFVGLGIGYLLDRHFHTKWIAVTLLLLGAAGGFFQLFTYLSRTTNKGDQ